LAGHDGPDDAGNLVGERDRDEPGRLLGREIPDPGGEGRSRAVGPAQDGGGPDDEQPAQVAVAFFGDPAEVLAPLLECSRGVSPSQAAKSRPLRKAEGSLTRPAKAEAPIGPTAGTVSRRRAVSLSLLAATIARSMRASRASSAAMAAMAGVLTGTPRRRGRVTASQIAAASAASVLLRPT
jgi:hypothetical protein